MDNFFRSITDFYTRNYAEITWFIIGVLLMALDDAIMYGDWASVLLNSIIIVANYAFWRQWKRRY